MELTQAIARHKSGLAHEVEIGAHVLPADGPAYAGGRDAGPTPEDHLVAALAACTAITLRMYANRKGWNLDQMEVIVEPQPGPSRGPTRLVVNLRLPEALGPEQVERLRTIAGKCPVHRALTGAHAHEIEDRVELIPAAEGASAPAGV